MGKSVQKHQRTKKRGKMDLLLIIPLTLIFVLVIYMIIQGIAERLGLSPIIILGTPSGSWMSTGESVLMYILWLGLSVTLGLITSYLIIEKVRK